MPSLTQRAREMLAQGLSAGQVLDRLRREANPNSARTAVRRARRPQAMRSRPTRPEAASAARLAALKGALSRTGSIAAAAEALGISEAAARGLLFRGRRRAGKGRVG